jgi:integrase
MAKKLSDAFLKGMASNSEERDTVVEGLTARKRAEALSFVFQFQHRGQRKKITLGQYPGMTLAEARERAGAMRGALQAGRMPHAATATVKTVDDLLDKYGEHLDDTAKTPDQGRALLAKHVRPALGAFNLEQITRRDVQGLIDRIKPASVAGAVGRYLTAAMNFGERRGHIEQAIRNLELPPANEPRQRIVSPAEIKVLMKDWLPHGPGMPARSSFGAIFALCLLTAARRTEISELSWSEVDEYLIKLPAARSKGKRPTTVVLSSYALQILRTVPRFDPDKVFPTERRRAVPGQPGDRPGRSGRGSVSGFSRAVADSRKRTGTAGWVPHDLRRTCATGITQAGFPPHVREAVLNHAQARLERTYNVHDYMPEKLAALEAWGAHVWTLCGWT